MRVNKSRTKGKNERIAFAATENAKVWTSVRKTYFSVDESSPERIVEGLTKALGMAAGGKTGAGDGERSINIPQYYQRVAGVTWN
jgi:hypothetical protein